MKSNTRKSVLLVLLSLLMMHTASAVSEIHLNDFTSGNNSNPLNSLGDSKALLIEVVLFVIGFFLVSCVLGIFASGSTANIGNILHSVTLRTRGITGIVIVIGVVFAVIITLVLFFHLYNKYLVGA